MWRLSQQLLLISPCSPPQDPLPSPPPLSAHLWYSENCIRESFPPSKRLMECRNEFQSLFMWDQTMDILFNRLGSSLDWLIPDFLFAFFVQRNIVATELNFYPVPSPLLFFGGAQTILLPTWQLWSGCWEISLVGFFSSFFPVCDWKIVLRYW